MTNKISTANGVCLCVSFVIANYIIYNTNSQLVQSHPIVLILGFVLSLILFAAYSTLLRAKPKASLFELIEQMFSPPFAKIILASYLGFACICAGYCLGSVIEFCTAFSQGTLPFIILAVIFILLCIYTAEKGVKPIAKFAVIGVLISVGLIVLSILLSFKDFDFSHFSLHLSRADSLAQASIKTALTPFGEVVILTSILSCHNRYSKPSRIFIWGGFFGMIILVLSFLRNLLILGSEGFERAHFPSYSALSVVGITDILSNLELFAMAVYLILCFIKICVCLLSAKVAVGKILGKNSGKKYVLWVGIAVLILSFVLPRIQFASAYLALCFVLELIIPLFMLFVIKSQKKTAG